LILFAAGGTGGHLYPALAIAEELRRRDPAVDIAFTGTPDHLEAKVVPQEGHAFHPIPVTGLPRRIGPSIFKFLWLLARGVMHARRLIASLKPDVVVGCGAYISAPAVVAARLAGIPVLLAESNAYPGIANRLLGKLANRVAVAIPGTERRFPPGRAICLGNPIRAAFGQIDRASARQALGLPAEGRLLLVTGGSLGAQALNEALLACLDSILSHRDWSVLHITGAQHFEQVAQVARTKVRTGADSIHSVPAGDPLRSSRPLLGPEPASSIGADGRYQVIAYCDRMPAALAAADLVVSRSGATIVAELTVAGRASLLVPLGINPDQAANARFLAEAGAAVVVPNDRVATDLKDALLPLLDDPARLDALAEAAKRLGKPDAASRIADEVLALATRP
jgi:UDP-N-acetylglucosamine--N-acetylmuramyl-(pentapeptide) pyrophosphoryl-undecaprenol N-acetylglucosamine transferase